MPFYNNTLDGVTEGFVRVLMMQPHLANHCVERIELFDCGHQVGLVLANPATNEISVIRFGANQNMSTAPTDPPNVLINIQSDDI